MDNLRVFSTLPLAAGAAGGRTAGRAGQGAGGGDRAFFIIYVFSLNISGLFVLGFLAAFRVFYIFTYFCCCLI